MIRTEYGEFFDNDEIVKVRIRHAGTHPASKT